MFVYYPNSRCYWFSLAQQGSLREYNLIGKLVKNRFCMISNYRSANHVWWFGYTYSNIRLPPFSLKLNQLMFCSLLACIYLLVHKYIPTFQKSPMALMYSGSVSAGTLFYICAEAEIVIGMSTYFP